MWVIMSRFIEFPEEWNSTDTVLFFVFPPGSWGTNEEKKGKNNMLARYEKLRDSDGNRRLHHALPWQLNL